jgi:hypothetical protein
MENTNHTKAHPPIPVAYLLWKGWSGWHFKMREKYFLLAETVRWQCLHCSPLHSSFVLLDISPVLLA